jgi:hypothetical protein
VAVWIKLGFGYFINRKQSGVGGNPVVINPDPGGPIGNFAAAPTNTIKYMV